LPDTRALHHVAFLYFGFGGGGLLFAFGLVASGSGELGFEVVLDLLLAGLLLLLERGEVALCAVLFLALLLLGRLLLLLLRVSLVPEVSICVYRTFFARSANMSVTSSTSLSSPVAHLSALFRSRYIDSLTSTRGVVFGRVLAAVHLCRFGDVAVAVDNCGALRKLNGLAGLALGEIGLCGHSVSIPLSDDVRG
jgi:hypothetical protein